MKNIKIIFVIGTRPEIIKMSSLIKYCQKNKVPYLIVHTNQHYSKELDQYFFKDLQLPPAKYNLHVGSKNHAEQTGEMMIKLEKIYSKEKPSHVFVQGDTNSVLAGALAAAKTSIKICHVEAGLRSNDWQMPEEINRIVVDRISDYLFCPTNSQKDILKNESVHGKIFVSGNTIVDAVLATSKKTVGKDFISLIKNDYILLTMHRPSNVDTKEMLKKQLANVSMIAKNTGLKVVFPIHPRTRNNINKFKIKIPANIDVIEPVGFIDMIGLEKNAKLIVTDSGGIQEESCILKVPCLILRENTERPECIEVGAGKIVGSNFAKLDKYCRYYLNNNKLSWKNPFGDGLAGKKIIQYIIKNS